MFIIDVSFTPDVSVAFISLLDICASSCFPVVALSHVTSHTALTTIATFFFLRQSRCLSVISGKIACVIVPLHHNIKY